MNADQLSDQSHAAQLELWRLERIAREARIAANKQKKIYLRLRDQWLIASVTKRQESGAILEDWEKATLATIVKRQSR